MWLQQQLAGVFGLAGHTPIQGAHGVEGAAESLMQACPGLGVCGVHVQPGVEALLQCCVRGAGAQSYHPVDGLFADGVQARVAHGVCSHR
ncbi:hypothetical protein D3C87_1384650 [compost metagenome]